MLKEKLFVLGLLVTFSLSASVSEKLKAQSKQIARVKKEIVSGKSKNSPTRCSHRCNKRCTHQCTLQ